MSGYDTLRAMRKGSDPDLEAWKKDINPYPRADPENDDQWQMRIDAIKGDLGYGEGDENGDWVPDEGSIYPHMKQLKEEGGKENEDEYRECVERGSTYTLYDDEPDLYYAATPTPIKPTTQTTIDAHAAGGDNVWQRGQTARQQAAMARDAQQAKDLARPYRMAPKVAYKQAQEEQNMEPTQKSAMLELPPIGEMIKGKREDPRENLAQFKKRDTRLDWARMDASGHNLRGDDQAWDNAAHDFLGNDGDRTGVVGNHDRNTYSGSRVGYTPTPSLIPEGRDYYINDMETRKDGLESVTHELFDECDDITNYAKKRGIDPEDLRLFIWTLVDHYRDNRDSAKQTKENLSSVVGDGTQNEEY